MKSLDLSCEMEYIKERQKIMVDMMSTPEGRKYLALSMSMPKADPKEYEFETWIPFVKALLNYEKIRNNNSN